MIVGIAGKKQSGKDTVGKIIQMLKQNIDSNKQILDFVNGVEISGFDYQIKKYADKLKDIVCLLIGCTREQLEDREFKEKELGEEWDRYIFGKSLVSKSEIIQAYEDEWGSKPSDYWLDSQKVTMTVRKLIQLLGTECGRQIIHPNIWVNALFADYRKEVDFNNNLPPNNNWIITDVRFPNELKAIEERGGFVIRVNRWKTLSKKTTSPDGLISTQAIELNFNEHVSETTLDNHKFKYVIDNNNSIEELISKVKEILIKENLI